MKTRSLFVCSGLMLCMCASGAYAEDEGSYQRTRDGKTLVWNSYPAKGDVAEWSGKQDKDGYATGQGTVIWYKLNDSKYTFAVRNKHIVDGSYTGKMVRGKLDGIVVRQDPAPVVRFNTNPERIFHATYVNGKRTSEWFVGRPSGASITAAPSSSPSSQQPAKEKTSVPEKEE
jgi:hypothetical protein